MKDLIKKSTPCGGGVVKRKFLITLLLAIVVCIISFLSIVLTATKPIMYGKNYKYTNIYGKEITVRFYDNGILNAQDGDVFYVYFYYIKGNIIYTCPAKSSSSMFNEDFYIDNFCSIHEKSNYDETIHKYTCSSAVVKMVFSILFFIAGGIWLVLIVKKQNKKPSTIERIELCKGCGYQLFDDDKTCPNCGKIKD